MEIIMTDKILIVENISKEYSIRKNLLIKENPVKALDDVFLFFNNILRAFFKCLA
jgi:hypothetical protein